MTKWNPGAWTPKRCALWRSFGENQEDALMDRLERWVWAEKERGEQHKTEIPPGYENRTLEIVRR